MIINGITDPSQFPAMLNLFNQTTQVIVNEEWKIPCGKPNIETIETVNFEVSIVAYEVIKTPTGIKVLIDGELKQAVYYTADGSDQSMHSAHHTEPFSTFIEINLLGLGIAGSIADVISGLLDAILDLGLGGELEDILQNAPKALIENAKVEVLEDKRTIKKRTVVFVYIRLLAAVVAFLQTLIP